MPIPQAYLDEILSRLPKEARVEPVTTARDGAAWIGGPLDCLCLERGAIEETELKDTIAAWVMHVATGGFFVFYGWTPGETPCIPNVCSFPGPDGRVWIPVVYEGVFLAFQCIGPMTDF